MRELFSREEFGRRLSSLRLGKGISARDMSLSLGQGAGYINNIENGRNLPSMSAFFEICAFLEITPKQFFSLEEDDPAGNDAIFRGIRRLSARQREFIRMLTEEFTKE